MNLTKGVDGLAAFVRLNYGLNTWEKGTVFLFCGRRADRMNGTDRSFLADMMPWSDAYRAYETEQKYEAIHNDFFDAEPPKPKAPPQHRRPLADVQNELCFG